MPRFVLKCEKAEGEEKQMTRQDIREIEEIIGYTFRDPTLLRQAFTRRSYTHEMAQSKTPADTDSNEVLEFIGDSILSYALVMILTERCAKIGERGLISTLDEGELTVIRSNLSDKKALSGIVTRLGLAKYMRVSRGDIASGIIDNASPKEDLFESIIAAVALDCGMDFSVIIPLVERLGDPDRLTVRRTPKRDPRSILKELCEKNDWRYEFETVDIKGPDHDRTYTVLCRINGAERGQGKGRSVKLASHAAASEALASMRIPH
jgi:ribonuclease-3